MANEIELRVLLCGPASVVYRLLVALLERAPDPGPGLRRLALVGGGAPYALSRWEAQLGALRVGWTQRERFDAASRRIGWSLLGGDGCPAALEGEWAVEELTECTSALRARLRVGAHGEGAAEALAALMGRNLELLVGSVRRLLEEGRPVGGGGAGRR